jgi:hypothetical protein
LRCGRADDATIAATEDSDGSRSRFPGCEGFAPTVVIAEGRSPERVVPGAMLLAGNRAARAVVRVVDKNRHLLGKPVA